MNRIMAAVAVVLALYGFFYIADLIFSHLHMYNIVFSIWTVFQLLMVAAILYIGAMILEIGRAIFKAMLLRRKSFTSAALMMTLIVSIPILIPLCSSLLLVYEDGLAGYYGDYRPLGHARITGSIDLQALRFRAQAKGYDVTCNPASFTPYFPYTKLGSSEEYWVVAERKTDRGSVLIICYQAGNETSFDYAVPRSAGIHCSSESPEDWYYSRLCEFFPHLTKEECHNLAETLLSGHSLNISRSPDWASIKNYLGSINEVISLPITDVSERYAKGSINYDVTTAIIKRTTILGIGKSATFTIFVNDMGFAKIEVNSEYFLSTDWIRSVYAWMFFDIGLPGDAVRKFTIEESWWLHPRI